MHNSGNCQCILGGQFPCVIAHLSSSETGSVSEWYNTVIKSRPSLQYHILWLLISCLIKIRKLMLITQYSSHKMKIKPLLAIFTVHTVQYSQQPYSYSLTPYAIWFHMTKVESFLDIVISGVPNSKKGRENDEKVTITGG